MTTIKYPTHRLDWLNEPPSILKTAVSNYLNEIATDDDLLIIRDYIKHWIELKSHQFENESDREILLRELGAIRLGKNDRLKTLKCKPSKEYKPLKRWKNLDNLRALWVKFPPCRYNSEA